MNRFVPIEPPGAQPKNRRRRPSSAFYDKPALAFQDLSIISVSISRERSPWDWPRIGAWVSWRDWRFKPSGITTEVTVGSKAHGARALRHRRNACARLDHR